jgi:hypothetical protein
MLTKFIGEIETSEREGKKPLNSRNFEEIKKKLRKIQPEISTLNM